MRQYRRIVIPLGFIDVDGSSLCRGVFYRRDPEDGIHLLVLDEGIASVFIYGFWLLLCFNLRGYSDFEDEFLEISFANQFLKVPSEGATIHYEVAPLVMEGAVVSGSRSRRVLWERFTRGPNPRLVIDGVENIVDRYPEWNEVKLYCALPLLDSGARLGGL